MMEGLKIRKSPQKSPVLLRMKSQASVNLDGFQFVFSLFIIGNLPFFYWPEYKVEIKISTFQAKFISLEEE